MTKTPVKFRKNRYKTVGGVAPTRCPQSIHFVIDKARKMANFKLRKMDKNNLRFISKPHAYVQTMTKIQVKFRKNRHKTVGGVAQTRYYFYRGTEGREDGRTEG